MSLEAVDVRNLAAVRYIRGGHRRVAGWLPDGAIRLIEWLDLHQKAIGIRGHAAEIGVHHGKLLILLALLLRSDRPLRKPERERRPIRRGRSRGLLVERGSACRRTRSHPGHRRGLENARFRGRRRIGGGPGEAFLGRRRSHGGDDLPRPRGRQRITLRRRSRSARRLLQRELAGGVRGTNRFFHEREVPSLVPFAIGGNKVFFTTDHDRAGSYLEELERARVAVDTKRTSLFGSPVLSCGFVEPDWKTGLPRTKAWRWLRHKAAGRMIKRVIGQS